VEVDEVSEVVGQSADGGEAFDEFLQGEYNNISQAHFNTIQSISEFFKVYIGIVSLPISVAVIFLKPEELRRSGVFRLLKSHSGLVLSGFGLIVLVSLCVLGYITNLRCDAVLYARTINGIRNYFYEKKLDIESESRYRVLPKRTQAPRYFEPSYFLFVVLAFATVATGYWFVGLLLFFAPVERLFPVGLWWFINSPMFWTTFPACPPEQWFSPTSWWYVNSPMFWTALAACPLAHIVLYMSLAQYRERSYLRSRILGVDIDGVLNDHRTHFCRLLREKVHKELAPDSISRIPVHEISGANVTERDEQAVFNWPSYWVDMPPKANAADMLKRIRNQLGYNIWLFTSRGWPVPDQYPIGQEKDYAAAWNRAWWRSRLYLALPMRRFEKRCAEYRIPEIVGSKPMRTLTKQWLSAQNIVYDKLIVERGNTDTRDPRFNTRNRFVISARRQLRAFVEDDLNKAKRLCDVCEVVFLIDQPYNQVAPTAVFPKNLIRVKEWPEVRDHLRTLF
jgi:uncharacterized HAD superfamily protein